MNEILYTYSKMIWFIYIMFIIDFKNQGGFFYEKGAFYLNFKIFSSLFV